MDGAYGVVMDSAIKRGLTNDTGTVPELEGNLVAMAQAAIDLGMKVTRQGIPYQYFAKAFVYVYTKALEAVIQWAQSPTGQIDMEFTAADLVNGRMNSNLRPDQVNKISIALPDAKAILEDLKNWLTTHLQDFSAGRLDPCGEM